MDILIVMVAAAGFCLLSERVIRIVRNRQRKMAIARLVSDLGISFGFGTVGAWLAGVTGGLAGLIAGVYTSWRIGFNRKER